MTSDEITNFRKEILGITQEQFAKLLEVAPKSVSRWERGETNPGKSAILKLDALVTIMEDENKRKEIIPFIRIATTAAAGGILSLVLAGIAVPTATGIAGLAGLTKLISNYINEEKNEK